MLSFGDALAPENLLVVYADRPAPHRRQEAVCGARRDIALSIGAAPRGLGPGILGMALPLSSAGVNVRVFGGRISEMAHEVAHVLLRTDAHEPYGIMTAVWTPREYDHMTGSTIMLFTREQSARMRDTLAGAGCEESRERQALAASCRSSCG